MNQNLTYEYEEELDINFKEMFFSLLDKWYIILLSGLTLALAATAYARFFIPETFESGTSIYIYSQQADNMTYNDLQLGSTLTKDYEVLIKSRTVLESAIRKLDLAMDYGQLSGMVSVNVPMNTRIVEIRVRTTDPYLSRDIADTVREIAGNNIAEVMGVDAVNVVEKANLPETKCSPNVRKYTVIGGALGVIMSCAVYVVLFLLNDTLCTQEDVEKHLGLSVVGLIPLDTKLVTAERRRKKTFTNKLLLKIKNKRHSGMGE